MLFLPKFKLDSNLVITIISAAIVLGFAWHSWQVVIREDHN